MVIIFVNSKRAAHLKLITANTCLKHIHDLTKENTPIHTLALSYPLSSSLALSLSLYTLSQTPQGMQKLDFYGLRWLVEWVYQR